MMGDIGSQEKILAEFSPIHWLREVCSCLPLQAGGRWESTGRRAKLVEAVVSLVQNQVGSRCVRSGISRGEG